LQLDVDALPTEIAGQLGSGLLQMFYCVSRANCPRRDQAWLDPFAPCQLLRRIGTATGGPPSVVPKFDWEIPPRRITGWEPVDDYPDRTELPDLGIDEEEDALEAMSDRGLEPRQNDKLLGWPSWPQYVDYPRCRICNRELWQVFSLESNHNLQYMFGDDGCGHVTCCPDHPDELAFQWSSY
jgi:hypothetical protein